MTSSRVEGSRPVAIPDPVPAVTQVLQAQPDIALAWVFGSFARGEARANSDLDVAISSCDGVALAPRVLDALAEDLEEAAGRRVDLVVIDRAAPLLAREILRDGRLVLCRSDEARVRCDVAVCRRVQDTEHLRAVQAMYLRERVMLAERDGSTRPDDGGRDAATS